MNEHDIAEIAYKNGYEAGKRDAVKWIPVTERLPENGKVLAIVKEDHYTRIAFVFYEYGSWWDCFYDGFRGINVTHWMPIPEEPKENDYE